MITLVLYGRNDSYGYNLHKRAVLSLNCMAEVLDSTGDEIIFVDYNTPDDYPTFPEAVQDILTPRARRLLRVLRVRPKHHERFRAKTHLKALEPIARNVAIRRSNPANRWILSTNTDMIFVPRGTKSLSDTVAQLEDGYYHLPRFELPETLWESLERLDPVGTIAKIRTWGRDFHLNEVVTMGQEWGKFDAPGDFQLALRDDLFEIASFDERMLLGWHVDSNIAKRLFLKYGPVRDILNDFYGYHCDHTRQVTPAHRAGSVQNDWGKFGANIENSSIADLQPNWGLADEEIEDIRLSSDKLGFVSALEKAIERPQEAPSQVEYSPASFNSVVNDIDHTLPFLADALSGYSRDVKLGWVASRADLALRFASVTAEMGFSNPIMIYAGDWIDGSAISGLQTHSLDSIASDSDILIVDFTMPDDQPLPMTGPARPGSAGEFMGRVFRQLALDEFESCRRQNRQSRRFICVNVVNTLFESEVNAMIGAARAPMSTRLRQGFVSSEVFDRPSLLSELSIGGCGERTPEGVSFKVGTEGHVVYGPHASFPSGTYRLALNLHAHLNGAIDNIDRPLIRVELVSGRHLLHSYHLTAIDLVGKSHVLDFSMRVLQPGDALISNVEIRLFTYGLIDGSLTEASLKRISDDSTTRGGNWLPMMQKSSSGEWSRHAGVPGAIEFRTGLGGHVLHGPYAALPPGDYRLSFEMRNTPSQALAHSHSPVLRIEIVSRSFFLESQNLSIVDLDQPTVAIDFTVPAALSENGLVESIETRIFSYGLVDGAIVSASIDRIGEETASPTTQWLPLLQVGDAGHWVSEGQISGALAVLGRSGHVVSGPYASLLAGRYEAIFTVMAVSPAWSHHDPLAFVEVVSRDFVLGRLPITQMGCDPSTVLLSFSVPNDVDGKNGRSDIEFRVWSSGVTPFYITSIRTRPLFA